MGEAGDRNKLHYTTKMDCKQAFMKLVNYQMAVRDMYIHYMHTIVKE